MTLQRASVGNGINLVFMGDAYTDKDMESGGLYETVMRQAMEEYFAIEPYKTFRNRFNVYAVKAVSPNRKIGEGSVTALGAVFIDNLRVNCDYDKCFEYATTDEAAPQYFIDQRTEGYDKYGWYANVDFTNDPTKVKWSAFLADDRYKDEVGIFEGGGTYGKGVYRPSENSMMRYDDEYFNAPSRWAIYKRIMELSGETADFEKFLEYDAVNRGNKASPKSVRTGSAKKTHHGAPPMVIR